MTTNQCNSDLEMTSAPLALQEEQRAVLLQIETGSRKLSFSKWSLLEGLVQVSLVFQVGCYVKGSCKPKFNAVFSLHVKDMYL